MPIIQVLLDSKPGPLPLTGQFQALANTVPSFFLSGTLQAASVSTQCTLDLQVYDQNKQDAGYSSSIVYSNEVRQHKNLLALPINQKPLVYGSTYTFNVFSEPFTLSDANDFYSLTIFY